MTMSKIGYEDYKEKIRQVYISICRNRFSLNRKFTKFFLRTFNWSSSILLLFKISVFKNRILSDDRVKCQNVKSKRTLYPVNISLRLEYIELGSLYATERIPWVDCQTPRPTFFPGNSRVLSSNSNLLTQGLSLTMSRVRACSRSVNAYAWEIRVSDKKRNKKQSKITFLFTRTNWEAYLRNWKSYWNEWRSIVKFL